MFSSMGFESQHVDDTVLQTVRTATTWLCWLGITVYQLDHVLCLNGNWLRLEQCSHLATNTSFRGTRNWSFWPGVLTKSNRNWAHSFHRLKNCFGFRRTAYALKQIAQGLYSLPHGKCSPQLATGAISLTLCNHNFLGSLLFTELFSNFYLLLSPHVNLICPLNCQSVFHSTPTGQL